MPAVFGVDGHFSAQATQTVDVIEHAPWVYVIACVRHRVIYIGETFDRGGLIMRLGTHFGPYPSSTLRKQAARIAGVATLRAPFIIVAARLPTEETKVKYDAASMNIRRLIEGIVHSHVATRLSARPGWSIVSTTQPSTATENEDILESCRSIVDLFFWSLGFLEQLSKSSPVHLVTLSSETGDAEEIDEGVIINRVEILLYEWLIERLKEEFGEENWWMKGVPVGARTQCATRQQQEGDSSTPIEAFLNLIDLKEIIRSNWGLFGQTMQKMTGLSGKDKCTQWIVEMNEIRKLWAHPIKQKYRPISGSNRQTLYELYERIRTMATKRVE